MTAPMSANEVALLLLAGGRSERFGAVDKLCLDLAGLPLGLHIARRLTGFDWAVRLAISSGALAAPYSQLGYTLVPAIDGAGMGDNIAAAMHMVTQTAVDIRAVMIVLADMPFVSGDHIQAILETASGDDALVASADLGHMSPPVLLGRAAFADLARLSGDVGARAILRDQGDRVTLVPATPEALLDIDTPGDLSAARSFVPERMA